MSDGNVLLKIREMQKDFTPTEHLIADWINAHPDEVSHQSIRELGEASGASEASVLRFCRSLGFKGYRDFIVAFSVANAAIDRSAVTYTDIRPGDSLEMIRENVFYNAKKALEDTEAILDDQQLDRAVSLIIDARRVDFFGIGASGLVCLDAIQKFRRINKTCYAHTEAHDQITAAELMDETDTAVLISYSGRTTDILDVYSILEQRGIPMIVITKVSKNPAMDQVSAVLHISSPEMMIRSGAMGSRIAMLTMIDILFSAVASRQYGEVSECLTRTHNAIESRKRAR